MKNEPLVSIVIPTFNRKSLLKKALESALKQTYKNLEILISDNHSEDGTEELCRKYLEKDCRIKYFRHCKNIGMTNNNNFIHEKVAGEYYVILCDDDWLDLDYVEKCLDFMLKNEGYTLITPATILYNKKYKVIKHCLGEKIDYEKKRDRFKKYIDLMVQENYLATGLFKTSIAKEIREMEGLLQQDRFAEDWIFMLKYMSAGKMKILSTTHHNKLDNGHSTTTEDLAKIWDIKNIHNMNFYDSLNKIICNSIRKDAFFQKYLTKFEINEITKTIEKKFKKANNQQNYFQTICRTIKWVIWNPLLLLKKETYITLYRKIKTLLIIYV